MEPFESILKNLENDWAMPTESDMQTVWANPEFFREYFIGWLKKAIREVDDLHEGFTGHLYALFFLSAWKETQAFPLLLELLALTEAQIDSLLGDIYTDLGARFLSSLWNEDWEALVHFARNKEMPLYSRSAVTSAMTGLYLQGHVEREVLLQCFEDLLAQTSMEDKNDRVFGIFLVADIVDIHGTELKDVIAPWLSSNLVHRERYFAPGFEEEILNQAREDVLAETRTRIEFIPVQKENLFDVLRQWNMYETEAQRQLRVQQRAKLLQASVQEHARKSKIKTQKKKKKRKSKSSKKSRKKNR